MIKEYECPELEIVYLNDVITASDEDLMEGWEPLVQVYKVCLCYSEFNAFNFFFFLCFCK